MAYTKKKKATKSVMIFLDGELYDNFKEITKVLKLDRDAINTRIYENGIREFIESYKHNIDIIKKEVEEAEKKIQRTLLKKIDAIQKKHKIQK